MKDSVLHPLFVIRAPPRQGVWVFIRSLVFVGYGICLPVLETAGLERKEVGKVVVNVNLVKPRRITFAYWVVRDVGVLVQATGEAGGVFGDEAALGGVVPAGTVVDEAGLGVTFPAGEVVARQLAAGAGAGGLLGGGVG